MIRDPEITTVGGALVLATLLSFALLPATALAAEEKKSEPPSVEELEKRRDAKPRDFDVRMALGNTYWVRARRALDERRFEPWHDDAASAMEEWLEAMAIDRDSARPHTMMGIHALYQGELERALQCLGNARRLLAHACRNVDEQVEEIELPEEIARHQLVKEMARRRRIAQIYGIRVRSADDPLADDDGDSRIEVDPVEDPDRQRRTISIEVEDESGARDADDEPKDLEEAEAPLGSGGFKGGPL